VTGKQGEAWTEIDYLCYDFRNAYDAKKKGKNVIPRLIKRLQKARDALSKTHLASDLQDDPATKKYLARLDNEIEVLSSCLSGKGHPQSPLKECARQLAEVFRKKPGRLPHYREVGEALAKWFREELPPERDGARDLERWAQMLAKRAPKPDPNDAPSVIIFHITSKGGDDPAEQCLVVNASASPSTKPDSDLLH
jgi:hypothetical protein